MPARPLPDETLHLIDAVRTALADCGSDVEERGLFGTHAFFVDGKMCIAVKGEELLVRLPPSRHREFQEMQNTRELSPGGGMAGYFWVEPGGYATRAQWRFWLDKALAYNPEAKASPRRKKRGAPGDTGAAGTPGPAPKATGKPRKPPAQKTARPRHSIFDADD